MKVYTCHSGASFHDNVRKSYDGQCSSLDEMKAHFNMIYLLLTFNKIKIFDHFRESVFLYTVRIDTHTHLPYTTAFKYLFQKMHVRQKQNAFSINIIYIINMNSIIMVE